MPRTDVPPPGQGKRSQRKAWRDKADQDIAIYSLAVEETPEIKATEDTDALSHALPYWDDAPYPQLQSHSLIYTEDEVQELIDQAYQEGWQQGVEEGFKLRKDKGVGYKEHKESSKAQEEEERPRKAKKQANEAPDTSQDTRSTSTSMKTTPSIDFNTHTVEIAEIDGQAVPGGTKCLIAGTTATDDAKTLAAVYTNPTASISTTHSSPNSQIIEIAQLATYNTSTSSKTAQTTYLHAGNTTSDVYDSYVVISNPQIAPSNNYNNPEVHHSINSSTSKCTIPDTQTDESTILLVDCESSHSRQPPERAQMQPI